MNDWNDPDALTFEERLRADERFRTYWAWIIYPVIIFMMVLLVAG